MIESQVFSWLETTRDLFDYNAIVSVVPPRLKHLDEKKVKEIEAKYKIKALTRSPSPILSA